MKYIAIPLVLFSLVLTGCNGFQISVDENNGEIDIEMFGNPTEFQRWNENSPKLM